MENQIVIAMKALIVHDKKVLIIKRSKTDSIAAGTWEFAGGKLEFGEDLEVGLKREIMEETGLTVAIDKLLYATTFHANEARQVVILIYLCHSDVHHVQLSDEHEDYKWGGKATILEYVNPEILKDLDKNNILESLDIMDE